MKSLTCTEYTTNDWGKLLEHVRNKKTGHGIPHSKLKGTPLWRLGRPALNEKLRNQYHKRKERKLALKAKDVSLTVRPETPSAPSTMVASTALATLLQPCETQTTQWKATSCWVRYLSDGTPVMPLDISLTDPTTHAALACRNDQVDVKTNRGSKNMQWRERLPTVSLRAAYQPPLLDAPAPSEKGRRVSPWPVKFKSIDIPRYTDYLTTTRGSPPTMHDIQERSIQRFFNMLEVEGQPITDEQTALDPRIPTAISISGLHNKLFKLPILDPSHAWTETFLDGLKVLCEFQLWHLGRDHLLGG